MAVQYFKQFVGIVLMIVFIAGAVYKIGENSDSAVVYIFIALIMLLLVWAIVRLLSED